MLDGKHPFDRNQFKEANGPVTAETLYLNQKVSDLISNAEMEQSDYRRGGKPNVFFGQDKQYLGMKVDVFVFNTMVLIGSSLRCSGCCTGFCGGNWKCEGRNSSSSRAKRRTGDPEVKL